MNLRRIASRVTIVTLLLALVPAGLAAQRVAVPRDTHATEANIARLTTNILENSQFSHHRFDDAMAARFLERYMDSLDSSRSLFLLTDVEEFEALSPTLASATRGDGDTSAGQAIFKRYVQRLTERTSYLTSTLHAPAVFDFTGHDVYSFDREQAERPRDRDAAQSLWREQLRSDYLQEKLAGKSDEDIVRTLTRRYEGQLRTIKAFTSEEVLETYLEALAHVYDPHSDYLGHEQMESLSISMNLSLYGIGATLESADGYCKVRELVPGGPAAKAGLLKPGDRILAVAQGAGEPVDITNLPLTRAVELIRGPKGSTVTLTVAPAGVADGAPPRREPIVRDEVKLEDQQAKARIVDLPVANDTSVRLGVIDLPSFYANMTEDGARRSATADVRRLLAKLKREHVQGVVLDLRRNGGGSLEEAISLTGLFIRTGPVVQIRDEAGNVEVGSDRDAAVEYDGPLVLLTSRFSASASEILAGALQDYGRALVVGDASTFGKGTVQNILPLGPVMDRAHLQHAYDPGALKVTTNKFYRPSGASTQLRGVASDIVLPSASDVSDVNESTLKDALPWDTVPAAPYDRVNRVAPFVGALRELSRERVSHDREFGWLSEDLARIKERLATKALSLNEGERRQELADAEARGKRREEAERSDRSSRPRAYEITLRSSSSPGLPPPVEGVAPTDVPIPSASADLETLHTPWRRQDIELGEALRILADYARLLGR
jgi:carboxyl-terminal processing protease